MTKLKIEGLYGQQKINGVSCWKTSHALSMFLAWLSVPEHTSQRASYRFFASETIPQSTKEYLHGNSYRVFEVSESDAQKFKQIWDADCKAHNQEFINDWVIVE